MRKSKRRSNLISKRRSILSSKRKFAFGYKVTILYILSSPSPPSAIPPSAIAHKWEVGETFNTVIYAPPPIGCIPLKVIELFETLGPSEARL